MPTHSEGSPGRSVIHNFLGRLEQDANTVTQAMQERITRVKHALPEFQSPQTVKTFIEKGLNLIFSSHYNGACFVFQNTSLLVPTSEQHITYRKCPKGLVTWPARL